jgi:hypothetical protein
MVEAILDLAGRLLCCTQHSQNQQKIEEKERPSNCLKRKNRAVIVGFVWLASSAVAPPPVSWQNAGGGGHAYSYAHPTQSPDTLFSLLEPRKHACGQPLACPTSLSLTRSHWRPVAHTILGDISRHDVGIDPRIGISNMTGKRRLKTSESSG